GHSGAFDTDLASLDGSNGFRVDGADSFGFLGQSVASAGDINGDGFADIVIGAAHLDRDHPAPGAAYVLYGHGGAFDASIDTANLDAADGFKISGVVDGDKAGLSVASAGDINGDGYADIVIGAPNDGPGEAFVVYGKAGGFADI